MGRSYLIRYGLMGEVGRFAAEPGESYERGQPVLIRSHRGTELGEVLIEAPEHSTFTFQAAPIGSTRILRLAGPDDLERAHRAEQERGDRFDTCQRVFQDGVWPLELIDVEPLLDDRRTVLHYLGAHRLDVTGILAAFRATCDLDIMLQPVGRDLTDEELEGSGQVAESAGSCGDCGHEGGGCATGGGCGTSHGGCADCGVKKLLASRR
jgi:cell fate regulator YaaT (PSP1 superfamily)